MKKSLNHLYLAFEVAIICVIVLFAGCSSTNRLNPDSLSQNEKGTFLTSQDFRSISQRLARSLIILPQIQRASNAPKIAFMICYVFLSRKIFGSGS